MKKANWLTLFVFCLATGVTVMNLALLPPGNARDEIAHLQVIDFYQMQHRLPLLPEDWADSSIEGHQAPLYYAAMAVLVEAGIVPEPESHRHYREYQFGNYDYYPKHRYNVLMFEQHWSGTTPSYLRSLHIFRVVSVLINALAALMTWRAAKLFFQAEQQMGVPLTLAFMILGPGFLQVIVGLNNNNMLFLFCAMATWMLVRVLRLGLDWKTSIGLGIALGCGMLSKLYMFPLVVAAPVVYFSLPRKQWKQAFLHLVLVGALTILIAGWWYYRNYRLYGEWTAAEESEKLLKTAREDSITVEYIRALLVLWTGKLWLESNLLFMTRAWLDVVSWILTGIFALGTAGLVTGRLQKITVPRAGYPVFGTVIPAILLAIYGADRNLHGDFTGPIVRAALPVVCLFFAAALLTFVPRRWQNLTAVSAVIVLGLFLIYFQFAYFYPQYEPLKRADNPSELEIQHRLSIDFENGARLIGYEIEDRVLQPGEQTDVKLCWEATQKIEQDYAFTLQLILPEDVKAAAIDGYPLSGRYPTRRWQPGTAFCEKIPLLVREDAPTPGAYGLRVGMYLPEGPDVEYVRNDGSKSNFLVVETVAVVSPVENPPSETAAQVENFAALTDYEVTVENNRLTLDFTWWVRNTVPGNYQYYLHALDANGELVAQLDRLPLDGKFPTLYWQPDVVFEDSLSLDVPPEAVTVKFGLYNVDTGQRGLWIVDGESAGDGLMLEISRE